VLRLSILSKLSALVAGAVVLTALAVNEVYVRGSNEILVERAVNDLEQEAGHFGYPLDGVVRQIEGDVQLLSNLRTMESLVRARLHGGTDPVDGDNEVQLADRLADTFREILLTREHYRRLAFIGAADDGKDVVRVERFGNRIERMPEGKLRHSGGERYFREALRLLPGQVYLSEPSLDRDGNEIAQPHTLVLRAAVPIYTADKEPYGIVLVNADFGLALEDIRRGLGTNRALYVTNASGDYLIHPDPAALYATDLGHDRRIQEERPRLLEALGNLEVDQATLMPLEAPLGNVVAFRKHHYDARRPDNYLGLAVEAPYAEIVGRTRAVERRGFLFSGAVALAALLAGVLLLRLLIRPLNRVAETVVRYRKGESDLPLPVDSPDEIGVLAREFRAMMRQKGEEDWVKGNLVRIARDLLGFKDLRGFAGALMEALVPAVEAQVGVLYLASSFAREQHDSETLVFQGAWGFEQGAEGDAPPSFRWGEGLVGSCARSRRRMLVTDLPEDYLHVASGLGGSRPRQLLLLPVVYENALVGVAELATVGEFTDTHLAFLEQLAFNVGVIVNGISAGMRTQDLLEEARQTAEELQRSEEELKTQQEELEASNEEMEEKTRALEEQNARIRSQAGELEESKRVIEAKARELEQASKYKSEFLANMSHELRTPLNSLLILARGLAANEEGNLTAEQIEEARVIHNGGLELLGLINDILDLSKVEAGKVSIVAEDVPFDDLVKRMRQHFEPLARESGVAFDVRLDQDLPPTLFTDGQRVEQILKNLLSNAFKFTEAGSVTLELRRAPADVALARDTLLPGRCVALSVTDTGIGIDESKLQDIFEAFQQEDGSTDRHYGGTGLGLTIARKFAHMLGGEVHVASKKGQGSTFTLFLPLGNEPARPPRARAPEPGPAAAPPGLSSMPRVPIRAFVPDDRAQVRSGDKVLLIVEDDRGFAATLMKVARKNGYKCLVAGDGKSGLLLAAEHEIAAVILDLRLPDIDGMRVLEQLKHDLRTRHVPVHIITGLEQPDGCLPLRKGAMGCLTKPVSKEQLEGVFARIEVLLRSELKRVLVVEDDRGTQVAIESLLGQKGVDLVLAGTGAEALRRIAETAFDCVILDLRLPDMTGFEWLEAVEEARGEEGAPPVVVYTAKELTEEEDRQLARYTGSIVIKGASSAERLLDEVTLFLHSVEASLSEAQRSVIRMRHDPDLALQNRTVLMVDDDLRNTFALSKVLKRHGMRVVVADNGQMALEKLAADSSIELVIMDIMMPVMDGYQAMRAIRADPVRRDLPIVALTARAMPEEQERCIEAGANDYLVKPVDVERLLTLLRVWLFRQEVAV